MVAGHKTMGRRQIVVVGGGFGGLACAQALAGADAQVTLVDRRNHHLFQPLLYQVSTAALSPADIAAPIRRVLARARNIEVILAEVSGIDVPGRRVKLADGTQLPYDQLVLATGSAYSYFAHPEWADVAPAPKSIADARTIRARLLRAFEEAERCDDPQRRAALMTIVVVGGGPTGVEMAGAVAELARRTLRGDFRRIDPSQARIVLVEAGPRLLAAFPERLSRYAERELRRLGVDVMLGSAVQAVDEQGVLVGGERIASKIIVWGAGIHAEHGADWLDVPADRSGRIAVAPNLAVVGFDDIYALGDVAALLQDGQPLPALAQVAQQQGRHLGRALRHSRSPAAFRYHSRGDTAVIGRHAAVYTYGRFSLTGRPAWLLWSVAHIFLLIGFERRMLVMIQWIWRYFTYERGARIID